MTVREYIEQNQNLYTEICYSSPDKGIEYSNMLGFLSDNTSEEETTFINMELSYNEIAEMNGCEFYLWLMREENIWRYYEDMDEEAKCDVRRQAKEMGYDEADHFLVIFG